MCVLSCVRLLVTPWTSTLLCPWTFPGKNPEAGCHFLLQGIFSTQGLKLHLWRLLHWPAGSLPLCHLGSPVLKLYFNKKKKSHHFLNAHYNYKQILTHSALTTTSRQHYSILHIRKLRHREVKKLVQVIKLRFKSSPGSIYMQHILNKFALNRYCLGFPKM